MSLAELAARQTAKARDVREETRRRFPEAVAFAKAIESKFGRVALKYASNGSDSIGKEPEPGMDWFATIPYRRGK
jgi:hypothetical protein